MYLYSNLILCFGSAKYEHERILLKNWDFMLGIILMSNN